MKGLKRTFNFLKCSVLTCWLDVISNVLKIIGMVLLGF